MLSKLCSAPSSLGMQSYMAGNLYTWRKRANDLDAQALPEAIGFDSSEVVVGHRLDNRKLARSVRRSRRLRVARVKHARVWLVVKMRCWQLCRELCGWVMRRWVCSRRRELHLRSLLAGIVTAKAAHTHPKGNAARTAARCQCSHDDKVDRGVAVVHGRILFVYRRHRSEAGELHEQRREVPRDVARCVAGDVLGPIRWRAKLLRGEVRTQHLCDQQPQRARDVRRHKTRVHQVITRQVHHRSDAVRTVRCGRVLQPAFSAILVVLITCPTLPA
mmetsp:Transcript_114078/g.285386  ORF Transcript_114078/g.285386 Transcript_114078/m.285386 type:complete len:274 (+) Transcript_114078:175-996(+)